MSKRVIDQIHSNLNSVSLYHSERNYKKALKFAEKACKQAKANDVQDLLNYSLMMKGNLLENLSEFEAALDTYEASFRISCDRFLHYSFDLKIQEDLLDSIEFSLAAMQEIDNPSPKEVFCVSNREAFENICEIYTGLIAAGGSQFLDNYAKTLYAIMWCYILGNESREHKMLFLEMTELFERKLAIDPGNIFLFEKIFKITAAYVRLCVEYVALEEAIEVLLRAMEVFERYDTGFEGNIIYHIQLHQSLTICYDLTEQDDRADKSFLRSSELMEELFDDGPDEPSVPLMIAQNCLTAGNIYLKLEKFDRALSYFEKALENAERIFEMDVEHSEFSDDYILMFDDLRDIFDELSLSEKKARCFMDSIKLSE